MNQEDTVTAIEAVKFYVLSGFYDSEKIVEIIHKSIFAPGRIAAGWLRDEIQAAISQKLLNEKEWPLETDCDRLDRVFRSLRKDGIIALQNAGNSQSDGLSDVTQVYYASGGKDSHVTGYCFYDRQDLKHVIERGKLWLAFGSIDGDHQKGLCIGYRIKNAAEAAGLKVDWAGSIRTRILVTDFNWQRRTDAATAI